MSPSPDPTDAAPRPKIRRRPQNANPLVSRAQQPRPRPKDPSKLAATKPKPPAPARPAAAVPTFGRNYTPNPALTPKEEVVDDSNWQTFKLTTTKASLIKDLRHHVMRLSSKREVNPTDEKQFTRPVRLHRRDPMAPPQGAGQQLAAANAVAQDNMDPEEKARVEAERAEKEAAKAANAAKVAPYGGAAKPRTNHFKKKTQQVYQRDEAEQKLRYEEFLPWFIEDFDNKNTWQGQLESSLSNGQYAMFVLDAGVFRMVPIEKWYKFTEKNKFKVLDIDDAEKIIKKNSKMPRWIMKLTKQEEKQQEAREREENMKSFAWKNNLNREVKGAPGSGDAVDINELDFDEDRFADDEEAPVMEGDEQENKEIERRMKKEYLEANAFDIKEERDVDEEEAKREREKELARKGKKKTNKLLYNHERNTLYDTDSDENPYVDSSDEVDSDAEAIKKEEEEKIKKEGESKDQTDTKDKAPGSAAAKKPTAPTGTPGGATPKVKPSPKKDNKAPGNNLKRSGSPELSESGTEKARKKPKKIENPSTTNGQPQPAAGKLLVFKVPSSKLQQIVLTPPLVTKVSKKRKPGVLGADAGSGEDTAGEMSDGARGVKKQRLLAGGRSLSPTNGTGSRPGSPVPPRQGSRAGSPAAPPQLVTEEEIKTALRQGPLKVTELIASIPGGNRRIGDNTVRPSFVTLMKRMTITNKETKMITLRPEFM